MGMDKTNAVEFEKIAREVFAPAYRVIAQQIKNETKIVEGKCLEIGTGIGYLGLALAEITDLQFTLYDISTEMLAYADQNIIDRNLQTRVQTQKGDVHSISLPDQSIDLVISRGSVFFWEDQEKAFEEIYRILAPGGMTFIGGGFGTKEILDQIGRSMDSKWHAKLEERIGDTSAHNFKKVLEQTNIKDYEINQSDAGLWIKMRRAK
ncbi:methyltransferase [Dehalobacter sp. UNSWDHB]|uniref:class I SAM-dependent methyltransferase n=1 Tax=Dehalobacter sp. UNSWDHB TaxID=1339256 RepID=UPI000387663E|nr:methyltransferase domain-containing protein [Dehalobacter sp. UNSWDHB]EQB22680.1 methyltransferase [Dehalobacter sp. UNSWDHB]